MFLSPYYVVKKSQPHHQDNGYGGAAQLFQHTSFDISKQENDERLTEFKRFALSVLLGYGNLFPVNRIDRDYC